MERTLLYIFILFFTLDICAQLPEGFVYVNNEDVSIQYVRYSNDDKFVSQPLERY